MTDKWATPLKPVAPDEMWCVWQSDRVYEWICGESRARELLSGGMTRINGEPVTVEVVDHHPALGGIQVRATISKGGFSSADR